MYIFKISTKFGFVPQSYCQAQNLDQGENLSLNFNPRTKFHVSARGTSRLTDKRIDRQTKGENFSLTIIILSLALYSVCDEKVKKKKHGQL